LDKGAVLEWAELVQGSSGGRLLYLLLAWRRKTKRREKALLGAVCLLWKKKALGLAPCLLGLEKSEEGNRLERATGAGIAARACSVVWWRSRGDEGLLLLLAVGGSVGKKKQRGR